MKYMILIPFVLAMIACGDKKAEDSAPDSVSDITALPVDATPAVDVAADATLAADATVSSVDVAVDATVD